MLLVVVDLELVIYLLMSLLKVVQVLVVTVVKQIHQLIVELLILLLQTQDQVVEEELILEFVAAQEIHLQQVHNLKEALEHREDPEEVVKMLVEELVALQQLVLLEPVDKEVQEEVVVQHVYQIHLY